MRIAPGASPDPARPAPATGGNALACAGPIRRHAERGHALVDDLADPHARIERGERILKNHLHRAAQRRRRAPRSEPRDSSPLELHPAAGRLINCRIALPTVVLPQPDSPTSASVRPAARSARRHRRPSREPTVRCKSAAPDREMDLQCARHAAAYALAAVGVGFTPLRR